MKRLTWLVGAPGAGKSTWARSQAVDDGSAGAAVRVVELTDMLGPLVDRCRLRKGVLTANGHLLQAVRAVLLHPDFADTTRYLVVAGLVREADLFPLAEQEEVWLLAPERARWEQQLAGRPTDVGENVYNDEAYAREWYDRLQTWLGVYPIARVLDVPFEPSLLGASAATLDGR